MKLSELQSRAGSFTLGEKMALRERVAFQKTIYLLQELGALERKYRFSWYIFGPYSPELAKTGFDFIEGGKDADMPISQEFDAALLEFKKMTEHAPCRPDLWLELLACLVYKKRHNVNKEEAFASLKEHQSYFNDDLLEKGWKVVSRFFP